MTTIQIQSVKRLFKEGNQIKVLFAPLGAMSKEIGKIASIDDDGKIEVVWEDHSREMISLMDYIIMNI